MISAMETSVSYRIKAINQMNIKCRGLLHFPTNSCKKTPNTIRKYHLKPFCSKYKTFNKFFLKGLSSRNEMRECETKSFFKNLGILFVPATALHLFPS